MNQARTGRVAGKRILVTGGVRGLGAACARRLSDEGARVIIADLLGRASGRWAGSTITTPRWERSVSGSMEVYDNSAKAVTDGTVPDPLLVLEMEDGRLVSPASDDLKALESAPEWTKPILEAALRRPPRD